MASATALATAVWPPIAPPSPIPFIPNGFSGEGLVMCRISSVGTSMLPGTM